MLKSNITLFWDLKIGAKTLVLVLLYDLSDPIRLQSSFNTNISCTYIEDAGLYVINIKDIQSIIAMVPRQGRFFVIKKIGLNTVHLGSIEDNMEIK